jgi:GMC oxidoreductase
MEPAAGNGVTSRSCGLSGTAGAWVPPRQQGNLAGQTVSLGRRREDRPPAAVVDTFGHMHGTGWLSVIDASMVPDGPSVFPGSRP